MVIGGGKVRREVMMAKVAYKVVRVVRRNGVELYQSVSPARLKIVSEGLDVACVADYLYYTIGRWTEALPNSMGIFVFTELNHALHWCAFASNEVILECEYKGKLKRVWLAVDTEKHYYTEEKWKRFLEHVYKFKHNSRKDFVEKELEVKCIWTPIGTYTVEAIRPMRVIEQGGNDG